MPDELTNSQIALLCDIGEYNVAKASEEQKRELARLVAEGYAKPSDSRPESPLKLTPKGAALLGERGAGLNEA